MELADVVRMVHVALVCYMVITPLFGNIYNLVVATAGYVLLFAHWFFNNDACMLTIIEQRLRGVAKSESFVQSIVGPVYGIGSSQVVWVVSLCLFMWACWRLMKKVSARMYGLASG